LHEYQRGIDLTDCWIKLLVGWAIEKGMGFEVGMKAKE
jgi:hypothetical protein